MAGGLHNSLYNSLSVTSKMLLSLATTKYGQYIVAKGNNIFEVTERLFTAGYYYSSLGLKATAFESGFDLSMTYQLLWFLATTNCGSHYNLKVTDELRDTTIVYCGITTTARICFSSRLCSWMIAECRVQTSKHICRKYDPRINNRSQLLKIIPDANVDNFSHPRSHRRTFKIIWEIFSYGCNKNQYSLLYSDRKLILWSKIDLPISVTAALATKKSIY